MPLEHLSRLNRHIQIILLRRQGTRGVGVKRRAAEFQSAERTPRDEEVALWSEQIIKALQAISGVQSA